MPAFTYEETLVGESASPVPFHPDLPVSASVGLIAETFRRLPGVLRSNHPSHSFTAYGRQARAVLSTQRDNNPLGPIKKLNVMRGHVLLLGAALRSCTAIHLAEENSPVAYLGRSTAVRINAGGYEERVVLEHLPGCDRAFDRLEARLDPDQVLTAPLGREWREGYRCATWCSSPRPPWRRTRRSSSARIRAAGAAPSSSPPCVAAEPADPHSRPACPCAGEGASGLSGQLAQRAVGESDDVVPAVHTDDAFVGQVRQCARHLTGRSANQSLHARQTEGIRAAHDAPGDQGVQDAKDDLGLGARATRPRQHWQLVHGRTGTATLMPRRLRGSAEPGDGVYGFGKPAAETVSIFALRGGFGAAVAKARLLTSGEQLVELFQLSPDPGRASR